MQNSPARLPDVGLGPRVGLPGRQKPVGYGTSWSVLVSGTSGRSGSSEPNLFSPFPSTNLVSTIAPLGSCDNIITCVCFLFLWWKVPKGYIALELFFVSARTNKKHHH